MSASYQMLSARPKLRRHGNSNDGDDAERVPVRVANLPHECSYRSAGSDGQPSVPGPASQPNQHSGDTPMLEPLDAMLTRLQLTGIRDQLDNLFDEAAAPTCRRARRWRCSRTGDRQGRSQVQRHGAEARALLGSEQLQLQVPPGGASARRTWPLHSAGKQSPAATLSSALPRQRWSLPWPRPTASAGWRTD